MTTTSSAYGHRQRHVDSKATDPGTNHTVTRHPAVKKGSLGGAESWMFGRLVGLAATMLPFTAMIGLIFGGCCSNVFSLETIVKEEPDSGLLITFVQFVVTALFTWPSHFSASHPPFFVKERTVPLIRWLPNIVMFFTVNMLNNFAFGYKISVPVHIILRSGGSVMTMGVGYLWGKRYSKVQVFSVAMLTIGIIMAAMGDAQAKVLSSAIITPVANMLMYIMKGKTKANSRSKMDSEFLTGLAILFVAQLLSAFMGLYTQLTYAKYGSHWHENLFYSHALSIPLFSVFLPSLVAQFYKLLNSTPFQINRSPLLFPQRPNSTSAGKLPPILAVPSSINIAIPRHILTLALNALTQFACIRGVNLLGARTSALGVSIVLNMRKLVSLFLSIWLFGNKLPPGVVAGAAVVFGSAGLWAWEGQRVGERTKEDGKKD